MKARLGTVLFVACVLGVAACGSSSKAASTGTPSTTRPTSAQPTSTPSSASSGGNDVTTTTSGTGAKTGHLGDTLSVTDLGGDTATVTMVRMIDPRDLDHCREQARPR